MRTSHRIQGEGRYYFKNYYQTKDNPNPWPTDPAVRRTIGFHDEVFGFQSILLDPVLLPGWGRYHFKACQIANDRMFEDVVWCIENC